MRVSLDGNCGRIRYPLPDVAEKVREIMGCLGLALLCSQYLQLRVDDVVDLSLFGHQREEGLSRVHRQETAYFKVTHFGLVERDLAFRQVFELHDLLEVDLRESPEEAT